MITLYAFHAGFGMPSGSPFVVKTMIHLAMAHRPCQIEIAHDLSAAPKGKLPYISDDGDIIADSELIRKHLEKKYNVDFDPGLSPGDKADAIAYTRLVEDHLYWCAMYDHWLIDENWAVIKPLVFQSLPQDQRDAIAEPIREQVIRDMHGQGQGRHSADENLAFAKRDLEALATRLGDRPFWFGERLTSADAAIAPQIQTIAGDPLSGPLNEALFAHPNLVAHAKRVLETAMPEEMAGQAA
ncbi:MAG: glutathione S-transferase family protein [Pseudomonadota bacterium]